MFWETGERIPPPNRGTDQKAAHDRTTDAPPLGVEAGVQIEAHPHNTPTEPLEPTGGNFQIASPPPKFEMQGQTTQWMKLSFANYFYFRVPKKKQYT